MGSARVMVVAADVKNNAYGSAEKKDIPVTSPAITFGFIATQSSTGRKSSIASNCICYGKPRAQRKPKR